MILRSQVDQNAIAKEPLKLIIHLPAWISLPLSLEYEREEHVAG